MWDLREIERDLGENWEEGWAWRVKGVGSIYTEMDGQDRSKTIASDGCDKDSDRFCIKIGL